MFVCLFVCCELYELRFYDHKALPSKNLQSKKDDSILKSIQAGMISKVKSKVKSTTSKSLSKRTKWQVSKGDCWSKCGGKGGSCPKCGKNGFCCSGSKNKKNLNGNCPMDALKAITVGYHVCVKPKQGMYIHTILKMYTVKNVRFCLKPDDFASK